MPILRVMIGLLFLVSGFEKVTANYQNFLYALQAYQFFPSQVEHIIARVFPWVEVFMGVFLILGLWTKAAMMIAMVCFTCFITVVGQALLRGIDISNCGCFGSAIHIPPQLIIVMDSILLLLSWWGMRHFQQLQRFSIDQYAKD